MQRLKRMELGGSQAFIETISTDAVKERKVDWCTDDEEHKVKDADNHEREPCNEEPASGNTPMRFAVQFMVHSSRCWVKPKAHTLLMDISMVGYENVNIDSSTEKKDLHSKPYYHRLRYENVTNCQARASFENIAV